MKNNVTEFDLKAAFKALDEIEIPAVKSEIKENLNESIRKHADTDCLLEDYYDVNDKKDLEKAADDRNGEIAKAKLARIEKIVDLDAKTEEDILPSYVGKDIIQCPQCMNLFYKDPADIEKSDENPDVVNVGEKCQHCGNEDGYTLIGKVGEVKDDELDKYEAPENELDIDFDKATEEVDAEGTGDAAKEMDNDKDELDLDFEEPAKDEEDKKDVTEEDVLDLNFDEEEKKEDEDKDEKKKEESFTKADATPLTEEVPAETTKPELTEAKVESGCESGKCESGIAESGLNEEVKQALKEEVCPVCGKEIESGCESGKCESGCESGICESAEKEIAKALNESIEESGKEESGIEDIKVKEKVELPNYDVKVEQRKDKVKVEVKPIKENLEEGCKKEKKVEELKEEAEAKKAEDLTKKLADWNTYIEYLRNQIKLHEEAYNKAPNEFVKAAIQKTIDAYKEDLDKALPEQIKAETALNDIPNPEDIKEEVSDKKKDLIKEEVINKDPNNAVVPCKVNKVIAHSEDEKPVDCLGEKKPLEKPLTEEEKKVCPKCGKEVCECKKTITEATVKEELENFVANINLTEDLDSKVSQKEFDQVFDVLTGEKKIAEDVSPEMKKHLEVAKEFENKITNEDIASPKEAANKLQSFNLVFESITDVKEESLNKIITEALTNVYENVTNFETTRCALNNNTFIVEGIINFKSGNKKETRYTFNESKVNDLTVELKGLNEDLAKDGVFTLKCALEDNKKLLIAESLNYNYKIGDNLVEGLVK